MSILRHGTTCFEVRLPSTRVLLDYDHEQHALLRHTPPTPINGAAAKSRQLELLLPHDDLLLETIDALLISSAEAMLALPRLTEFSAFRGRVFATEAALHFGRQLMLEVAAMCVEEVVGDTNPESSATPAGTEDTAAPPGDPSELRRRSCALYSTADVHRCCAKVGCAWDSTIAATPESPP